MSRKSIENRLSSVRRTENRWAGRAAMFFGTSVGLGAGEVSRDVHNNTDLLITGLFALGGIISSRNAASQSRTAASLEGVLAQDELYQPDDAPVGAQTQEAEFHDWQDDTHDQVLVPERVDIRPSPNET